MSIAVRIVMRWPLALLVSLALLAPTVAHAVHLDVLFLGDNGHHQPQARFAQLQPVFAKRDIRVVYTDKMTDLNAENLANYDALLVYANIDSISDEQASALLKYVGQGGGFVPLHCATFCFRNNDEIVALMGAQFQRHGTGVFRTQLSNRDHLIMKGFGGFESWDETYVHHKHNEKNRTVLEYRVDQEGREPWTWTRTHGNGRVFYTAWGHDQRTWSNLGFQNLLERGVRWAAGDRTQVQPYLADQPFPVPEMTPLRKDVQPFEYTDVGAKIPNYTPGEQWGTQAKPFSKMQKPLPAEESLKHIVTPTDFRVELFASDPDIKGKPICMAWDERGRLWIAETYDYPNELQPRGKGRDRIRILEDTDGDWRADKFTVFADKLSIPTSIAFYRGGVIVQDGTRAMFLKDNDGDDVSDVSQLLIDGWSQGDTHGGVSNFQYGLDNWIWAMQGYNNSTPKIDGKGTQTFRQGFFRFRPDGSDIEFIRSTNNNTWGLGISEEGVIFGSTANRNPSVYMPIPNRYYERVRGWTARLQLGTIADTHLFKPVGRIRQVDQHGGYTAGAGHALYTARQYPKEYWNRTAFVAGPTGHLVGTFVLKGKGADFSSTSPFNLFASDDEWSAPIMAEVGPDGNVWVLDWYNYIVQHNPTPQGFETGRGNAYKTDLRDKRHGRIYRVVHGKNAKPFTLADADTEKLVATLRHPTMLWRKHAQRLLVERQDASAVPALINLVNDPSVDEIGLNVGAIHALWTLHGFGAIERDPQARRAVLSALQHSSAGVQRNALLVLPHDSDSVDAILKTDVLLSDDGQVQLAALLALADMPPSAAAGPAILTAMQAIAANNDHWLNDAAISAGAAHASSFLSAVAKSTKPSGAVLQATQVVANHYGRIGPVDSVATVIAALPKADPQVAGMILNGLAAGWPEDQQPQLTPAFQSNLKQVMSTLPTSSRGVLVKLARQWGSREFEDYARTLAKNFLDTIDDEELEVGKRLDAAQQLVDFQPADDDIVRELLKRITPQTPPSLAVGTVQALQSSQATSLGKELTARMERLTPSVRAAAISVLLSRTAGTGDLLDAMDQGIVPLSELSLDQKQALLAHPDKKLQNRAKMLLSRGGALPDPDRQRVLEELLPVTKLVGNVEAGKQVFKKSCAICHMHSGEGKKIGPDLTGMAVHPKHELLTHIIDPSRDVEGNFRVYSLQTEDGETISGLLASESKTTVEIFDAKGEKKVLLREDIARMKASTKSLMPEGFEKQVTQDDLSNLLEFLTARGKFLPISLKKAATIASDRGMFVNKDSGHERLLIPDWKPVTFQGVPFHVADPAGGKVKNVVMLYGPHPIPRSMPKSVQLPCNGPARAIHILGGISGWGFPLGEKGSVSMIVRLQYEDGATEDHELKNGIHFADYIRKVDVPESKYVMRSGGGQQIRYLAVFPKRKEPIKTIELVKGPDATAPVVMAVTLEN